ncbi:SMC-Scp complex subunit ScpB [Micrococcus terreus]|uniref:SMC-Scp complex subunit ScpB n=1 Tax=Micrococcus terreus TaxID=574650 RepID=UPI00254E518A|nr:SMC-Scp complex subunit ScpB [Micrococcus terreus]MDK7701544.1 SMC-Scp complex subunit ScpB [Micrococcus terreus]WOO98572.1 SMC-Scp complex subunit ScpB [Micrococcus terreus]
MSDQEIPATPLRELVEAVLMVVDEPVTDEQLAEATGADRAEVHQVLTSLVGDYNGENGSARRGFELREVAGGWRIYSRPAHAEVVERFIVEGQTARLTQAALETLAVVAYLQPVTRSRVAAIRGVNTDTVMRTLVSRGLVSETGSDPLTGAVLYGTTGTFLQTLGVDSLEELPRLSAHLPGVGDLPALAEADEGFRG